MQQDRPSEQKGVPVGREEGHEVGTGGRGGEEGGEWGLVVVVGVARGIWSRPMVKKKEGVGANEVLE